MEAMWMLVIGIVLLAIASVPYLVYLYLGWRSPRPQPPDQSAPVPVSILIPTYNEVAIVRETLERLISLNYPNELLEFVIVDSSTDGTADVVRSFFDEHDGASLVVIEEDDRGGVARAVNKGVEAATYDTIFRTDCDARLDADAIQCAVATLQQDGIGGVTGRQVDVIGESAVEESYRSMQARNQALETHIDSVFMVHGPCFAFRAALFEEIPIDTIADDTEIAVRIRKRGHRVVMNPDMLFEEVGVSDIRKRRGRKDRRAMGLLQVLWRHRDVLGKYGGYGRFVIPANWSFLVVAPWLTLVGIVLGLLGAVVTVPVVGAAMVVAFAGFVWLGQRDLLGPLEALYTVFDANLSLVIGALTLVFGNESGTWTQDVESRKTLEEA